MISFGTDGWRGVIADDFTIQNVRLVTQAVCDHMLTAKRQPLLVIGYDTRFMSDRFAREAAGVAAGNGINVMLTDGCAPTPAVSYAVVDYAADGGIMFTASHNPYRYNGLKFKESYGGSAGTATTAAIERHLKKRLGGKPPAYLDYAEAVRRGTVVPFDAKSPYLARLSEIVDRKLICRSGRGVVVDPMYGAGQGYLSHFLLSAGCDVAEIRCHRDPYFGGANPEPLGQHLAELKASVSDARPLGIALDGDADRIGAVDADGAFISSHKIFSLLLRYLVQERGMTGDVVKTVSTTGMVDQLAAAYGLVVHETPIGFKYICEHMVGGDILIGGEESGGIGIKGHLPERDGMLMGALLAEMVNYYDKTLGALWNELQAAHGTFCYDRVDEEMPVSDRSLVVDFLGKHRPEEIGGVAVLKTDTRDGFKYTLADGSWLMVRPSGTEGVVRVYAEAGTPERVVILLKRGRSLIRAARSR